MPLRRLVLPLLVAISSVLCSGSIYTKPAPAIGRHLQPWKSTTHVAQFAAMETTVGQSTCTAIEPPQALTTPNPLLDQINGPAKITVSFIVSADGQVQSPYILESAGATEDRIILNTISTWRFRPATCNGVPTESEAKIAFSSR